MLNIIYLQSRSRTYDLLWTYNEISKVSFILANKMVPVIRKTVTGIWIVLQPYTDS